MEIAPLTIPTKTIGSPRRMLTIFWSLLRFRIIRVIRVVPKGAHFDATHFRDNILYDVDCIRPADSEEDD
jgi:hypothetical protein